MDRPTAALNSLDRDGHNAIGFSSEIDMVLNYIEHLEVSVTTEKEHSAFLEELLETLYGDGWDKLTISDAINCKVVNRFPPANYRCNCCGKVMAYNFAVCDDCARGGER